MDYPKFIVSNQKEESISIQSISLSQQDKRMGDSFQDYSWIQVFEADFP